MIQPIKSKNLLEECKMCDCCDIKIIKSDKVPQPIAPYSLGVKACHFIFVSGQLGLVPQSGSMISGGIKEQTRQALGNIKNILESAQSGLRNIVKTTVFLMDLKDFATFNDVYAEFFNQDPPARSAIQVAGLPKDGLVEIEVIATVNEKCSCADKD
jgi:2-iminobutanoate/2-iminopropanoate deaminase